MTCARIFRGLRSGANYLYEHTDTITYAAKGAVIGGSIGYLLSGNYNYLILGADRINDYTCSSWLLDYAPPPTNFQEVVIAVVLRAAFCMGCKIAEVYSNSLLYGSVSSFFTGAELGTIMGGAFERMQFYKAREEKLQIHWASVVPQIAFYRALGKDHPYNGSVRNLMPGILELAGIDIKKSYDPKKLSQFSGSKFHKHVVEKKPAEALKKPDGTPSPR